MTCSMRNGSVDKENLGLVPEVFRSQHNEASERASLSHQGTSCMARNFKVCVWFGASDTQYL
jgi:hypothetical protein